VTTHDIKGRCPICKAAIEHATNVDPNESGPKRGDVTLCAECGTVLMFEDDELRLRQPTEAEMLRWPMRTLLMLQRVRAAFRKLKLDERAKR